MNVMTHAPGAQYAATPGTSSAEIPTQQNTQQEAVRVSEVPDAREAREAVEAAGTVAETAATEDVTAEPTVEQSTAQGADEKDGDDKADDKSADDKSTDDKTRTAKPKRKSAPRKAAGTKALVVLREGRVQYVDPDTVLVIDLDEAASPDTDVHDVVDRLTELRDALDCPGKSDAVKALTDLIQEKALA